jgi:hypothetical protein
MSFTFNIKRSHNDDLMISALKACSVPALAAATDCSTVDEAISFWTRRVAEVTGESEGFFVENKYQNKTLGFGWGFYKGSTLLIEGGFYGNINGSRKYALKADWWNAFCEFAKQQSYEELVFEYIKGTTLKGAIDVIRPKISYISTIEDVNETLGHFKIRL